MTPTYKVIRPSLEEMSEQVHALMGQPQVYEVMILLHEADATIKRIESAFKFTGPHEMLEILLKEIKFEKKLVSLFNLIDHIENMVRFKCSDKEDSEVVNLPGYFSNT